MSELWPLWLYLGGMALGLGLFGLSRLTEGRARMPPSPTRPP